MENLKRLGLTTYELNGEVVELTKNYGKYYLGETQVIRREEESVIRMKIANYNKGLKIIGDGYKKTVILRDGNVVEEWNRKLYKKDGDDVIYGKHSVYYTVTKEEKELLENLKSETVEEKVEETKEEATDTVEEIIEKYNKGLDSKVCKRTLETYRSIYKRHLLGTYKPTSNGAIVNYRNALKKANELGLRV